ncbi:MAG: histidine phosphatase family protein [Candidatus Promineifilaceae bacterium]|nr:histidine phosphatase family protein [Candidatus Promineifilaceae bacterium]
MTTTIILIRHGQTGWNVAGRWQGHTDVPLNEPGREQAHLLAARLRNWPISAIYSSDSQRAAETAAILGRALGMEPVTDHQWRERHGGLFQGLTRDEIRVQYPQAWKELQRGTVEPPEGESSATLRRRAETAYNALLERHSRETVAVVSHGGLLRALIGYVLGLPADVDPPISLHGNTGISIVEVPEDGRARLIRLNDTAHLEGDQSGSEAASAAK